MLDTQKRKPDETETQADNSGGLVFATSRD